MMVVASGLHGDLHPGQVGGGKAVTLLLAPDAVMEDHLPAPGIETEDPVGLGNGMPAFNVMEGLACPPCGT